MAEFMTSQEDDFDSTTADRHPCQWWNIWLRRQWPYGEVLEEDTLYWYSSSKKAIVSRSRISRVDRFHFSGKPHLFQSLKNFFGPDVNEADGYTASKPDAGYCLAFKVKWQENLNILKPDNFRFPQLGWARMNDELRLKWFGGPQVVIPQDSEATLDNLLSNSSSESSGDLLAQLREINERMQGVNPERLKKLIEVTLRKDTSIVQALKQAAGYKCQFPGCSAQIKTKSGALYVEVAHIEAVEKGGKSVLGNLLVLCPNHHKEFDHGQRKITQQSMSELVGELNGCPFSIKIF